MIKNMQLSIFKKRNVFQSGFGQPTWTIAFQFPDL